MSLCIHCDQVAVAEFYIQDELKKIGPFCCNGCLTVFNVINMKGLAEYYSIKKNVSIYKSRAPVEFNNSLYSYLDDEDFLKEYSYKSLMNNPTMEFYLEGIHCLACLWIIEKLPEFIPGVNQSKLNLGKSIVTVSLKEDGHFSKVARELESIGYRPHPLKVTQELNDYKIKENRAMLLRIGVAGAAAGNIMLYAVSLYAGAGPEYSKVFNALTVFFAFPVLTYSAFPFFKNSFIALKNKMLSIDIPISLALVMGGIMGIYNMLTGVHENYFDSLTALVFLLLLSRYFLNLIHEKSLSTTDLHFFYQGDNVLRLNELDGEFHEVHPKFLKINDKLKILANQTVPADSIILEGQSYLNTSLLTGESRLQKVNENDEIYSGTVNVSSELIVEVKKIHKETRLGHILKNVEDGWSQKSKIVDITNKISKYFVVGVFGLSALLFVIKFNTVSLKTAIEQALTLLIVTCPCALAIATPLTFIRTLAKSAQLGIVIKDDSVIEKLASVKNIFIDKTGTLTENRIIITDFTLVGIAKTGIDDIIYNLEKNTRHPIGKALQNSLNHKNYTPQDLKIDSFQETPGLGVCGFINNHFYEIKNYSIFEDNKIIANFNVKDALRPNASNAIRFLRDQQINFKILSGDKIDYVKNIAEELNLAPHEFMGDLSPEDKGKIIKESIGSVMIGDGANDSIAMSFADVGIAVHGAMDISLRASDVYLTLPGMDSFIDLLIISKETMKVIYRNLALSILYNSISVVLAFTGHISPLTAAIIMPLSSLTVLISTLIGTKELRKKWKS